jgi:hypothetical protein
VADNQREPMSLALCNGLRAAPHRTPDIEQQREQVFV